MKIVKWLVPVMLVLLPVLVFAQDKIKENPVPDMSITLDSQTFNGFDSCRISK